MVLSFLLSVFIYVVLMGSATVTLICFSDRQSTVSVRLHCYALKEFVVLK